MIMQCTCKNAYQDEQYGAGMRVVNPMKKPNNYRCTSCTKVIEQQVKKDKEEKVAEKEKK